MGWLCRKIFTYPLSFSIHPSIYPSMHPFIFSITQYGLPAMWQHTGRSCKYKGEQTSSYGPWSHRGFQIRWKEMIHSGQEDWGNTCSSEPDFPKKRRRQRTRILCLCPICHFFLVYSQQTTSVHTPCQLTRETEPARVYTTGDLQVQSPTMHLGKELPREGNKLS